MLGVSYGQAGSVQPTATQTNMTSKYYNYLGYVGVDSGLFIPSRDTIFTPKNKYAAITRRPQDQYIYYYDSTSSKWKILGSALNAYVNGGNSFGSAATIGLNDSFPLTFKDHNFNFFYLNPTTDLVTGQGWTAGGYNISSDAISAQHRLYIPNDTAHGNYSCIGCSAISSIGGLPYYTNSEPIWLRMALYSDIPSVTGFVPYTGATSNVNLGAYNLTATAITSAKGLLDTTAANGVVTPTQLSLKLNKSNFIDSLNGRNATLLGNTTTGSGSTIVLSGSPTLTLPNIAAVNVSGGILSFPTGASGTVALRGDTTTYFYPYSSNPKNFIGLTSLSATRNVSSGSIFTYNSSTGAYNFDTTKLAPTLTANAPLSIVSNVIKADTTTRFTGLATLGKTYNDSLTLAAAIAAKSLNIGYDILTDSSTITWNVASNQFRSATVTLAGTGRTLTITNPVTNGFYTLKVKQDGTGNRTITTFPSTTYWSYGSAPPVTLTGEAANQVDIICFWYTGSSTYYGTFHINFK